MGSDIQNKSVLTAIGMSLCTAVATWMVTQGIIGKDDIPTAAASLFAVLGLVAAAVGVWYQRHITSQKSVIQSVNSSDNGVVAVPTRAAAMAGIQPVNEPLPTATNGVTK